MPYYLHPSVNITEISANKTQISHVGHEITIEEQNENIQEFIRQIRQENFPECLKEHHDFESLVQIFDFFLEHKFLANENYTGVDALSSDLQLLNQISDPTGEAVPPRLFSKVDCSAVNLFGNGELFDRVHLELEKLNIKVNTNPKLDVIGHCLMICCTDRPNIKLFNEINSMGIENEIPILFANLDGKNSTVGPFVMPGETSCFSCYTHRLAPNWTFVEEAIALQERRGNIVASKTPYSLYALETSFHVISQIIKFHHKSFHLCLMNEVLELDLLDYELDIRPVLRIPHCKSCYSKENNLPHNAVRALL
jgi:bacteriocin biosynthesis cyclodehydratase domain-containing protein